MYGQGIIRSLIHQTVEISHIEVADRKIIVVFKNHNNELIKTEWENNSIEENIIELSKDPKFIFFERMKKTVTFKHAYYLVNKNQKIDVISERDYRWCEFNYCDSTLEDNFIETLVQSGKKYLDFERYLEIHNKERKDMESI